MDLDPRTRTVSAQHCAVRKNENLRIWGRPQLLSGISIGILRMSVYLYNHARRLRLEVPAEQHFKPLPDTGGGSRIETAVTKRVRK